MYYGDNVIVAKSKTQETQQAHNVKLLWFVKHFHLIKYYEVYMLGEDQFIRGYALVMY